MPIVTNLMAAAATIPFRRWLRKLFYNNVIPSKSTFLNSHLCLIVRAISYLTRNKYKNWLSKRKNETGTKMRKREECPLLYENPIVKAKYCLENNSHCTTVQRDANAILHLVREFSNSEPLDQITVIQTNSSEPFNQKTTIQAGSSEPIVQITTTLTTSGYPQSKEPKSEKPFRCQLRRKQFRLKGMHRIIRNNSALVSKTRSGRIYSQNGQ